MKNLLKIQALTIILVTLFLSAFCQESNSENSNKKKHNIWFGLRAGTDFVSPTTDYQEIKNQLNSNMQLGAFVKIGKKLFIQPEIYGQFLFENELNTRKVVANAVKVPVLLGFDFMNFGIAKVHLMAGPLGTFYVSPGLNQKYDYKIQLGGGIEVLRFISLDVRYSINMNDNINDMKEELRQLTWDSGVNVTIGIQFR